MLFHEPPGDPWTEYDFLILEAYQILQDEICNQCGHPVWLCRTESNRVGFKVKDITCFATKELEKARDNLKPQKERETDKAVKKRWGMSSYTVPFSPPNSEGGLPTRNEYYAEMKL